jgi:hypothetical protein
MAVKQLSALVEAGIVGDEDLLLIRQGGEDKKVRAAELAFSLDKYTDYEKVGDGFWVTAATFTAYDQYMLYEGSAYAPLPSTILPYVVGSSPNSSVHKINIGGGVSQYLTPDEVSAKSGIPNGYTVSVISLGNSTYKISPTGTASNIGDISMASGQVAVLQPLSNGDWDVTHFGVKDDQSNVMGSQIELLRNAAKRAALKLGTVNIPNIKINVSGTPINEQVFWRLAPKTEFNGLPGVSPSFVYDMTQLGGKLIAYRDAATSRGGMLYLGDPTYAVQKETGRSQTSGVIVGASQNAGGGIGGYTNTKPATNSDQGTIAVKGVVVNDNITLPRTAWAGYLESVNLSGTTGITQTLELAMVNKGAVADFTPASAVNDNRVGLTMNLWVGTGIGESDDTDSTMAIGIVGGVPVSTAKFLRGIVFKEGCTRTGEVIAASASDQVAWYDTRTGGNGKLSYISGANTSSNRGRVAIGTRNLSSQTFNEYTFDRVSFSYSITNSVDLGSSALRFKSLYLQNSPDVVSDENKKTSKRSLSANEISAGLELARNIQMFKWISEVAEKGEPDAYYHTSVMAQGAWQILIDNNLNPTEYGFISNNSDGWSVMPTELSMLMCAAIVKRQDELEARIANLEGG